MTNEDVQKNDLLRKLKKPMLDLNLARHLKYKLVNSSSFDVSKVASL